MDNFYAASSDINCLDSNLIGTVTIDPSSAINTISPINQSVWTSSPTYIYGNNYATINDIEEMLNSMNKPNEFAEGFLSLLTPSEISRIWEKIKSRSDNKELKKNVLKQIILVSVMSEKFILENIELIDKRDLMKNHKQLIESGQYKQVKLYYAI